MGQSATLGANGWEVVSDGAQLVISKENPLTGGSVFSVGDSQFRALSIDASKTDSFKGIATNAGWAYVRFAWDATYDAVQMVRVTPQDAVNNGCVDFYGVRLIPIATDNSSSSIASAFAAASGANIIAAQSDSAGPLNYNSTFIGANHGPFILHTVTAAGHGKTSADIGSEWNGPSSRLFYIAKVVDANTLWLVSNNSATHDKWSFYTTSLAAQTLTHAYGATATGNIVITADTVGQLTPALNKRSLDVQVDSVSVEPNLVAIYTPKSFKIIERYSIINPADAMAFIRARVGTNPKFNDDSVFADVDIVNSHNWNSNGCHTVEQTVTWNSAVTLAYQYVVQDIPPNNVGVLTQYIPGVASIGGADYKAGVDISSTLTPFSTATATWLDAQNPPSRMAQIVSVASVNKYGTVLGYSPLRGVTTRKKRLAYTDDAGGIPSAVTKKMYPRVAMGSAKAPAIGDTYTALGYHHVYNSTWTPDATVATWFKDGDDYVVVVDFHKVSALSRVSLPAACDGFAVRMVDSLNVILLTDTVIDSGGIAVSCSATYGYAVIRVSPF